MSRRETKDLIREGMDALGVNQKEFAGLVGVDPATVNKWLKGSQLPSRRHVPVIARVLGIDESAVWAARSARQDERLAESERDNKAKDRQLDRALERVTVFVKTYESFHAAYRQMGEQIDTLVEQLGNLTTDMADLKRDVRSLRPKGER